MKEIYVQGYDTVVEFPDDTTPSVIKSALQKRFPETDDQFVARIKDPSTQAADVSFKDFQRYKQLDTGMELLEVPGVVAQAASIAAKELYDGAKAAINLSLQGERGKAAASLAEGATRGTTDLVSLGRRIGEGFYQHLEPYVKETGKVEVDQYHRFLALKSLDNIRESARAGDSVLLEEFGLTPEMIDNDLAEGSSYFLDPTMVFGFGAGPVSRAATRFASKPVRMAGAGLTRTAQGIRRAADRLSGLRTSATEFLDDATAGYGKYAGAGLAGAAATSAGMGPALGAAGTAFLGLPALEVAGAGLSAFGDAMRLSPTRIGGLQQLALNTPDTIAGKVAGKLQFLDRPIEYLGRTAGGAAAGAGLGAGLGLLANGIEGAAQGFGAGFTSGAVGGIAGRFAEGLTGSGLRRAEINDYKNWRKQIDKPLGEYFDKYFTDHSSRTKGMDLVQLVQTAAAEKNHNVQILEPKDYDARFKNRSEGVAIPEGDAPIVYLRGVFDGKRGKDSALRLLSHEVFHAIARLDGFDVLAKRIGQDASAMYSPDEIGEFVRTYQNKLDPTKPATLTENQRNNIGEELGAEYFSDLILGKDSSYILRGDGLGAAIKHMIAKLMPGKFSRVIETFESPVFGPMKRANPALRRALNDLVTARRKAYKNVMLADGTPTVVYNEADLGDDKVYQELEALGAATTDNKGRRKMLGPSAEKRIERDRVLAVAAALDKVSASTVDAEGGGLVRQSDGSYVGKRFSPSQVEAIINEPGMPDKVIEGVQFIAGSQGLINVTYAAALAKIKRRGKKFKDKYLTRYRNLPYTNRDVAMYQIVISPKPGTMRTELLDMSFLQAKAANNWDTNQAWQTAFGNVDSMVADVKTYINALGGDVPTAQVLGSETKRNLLNKFLGVRNVKGNPLIAEDYKVKEGEHPWRSFRLDRIISMKPRNEAAPTRFSRRAYEQGQMNFSPYDPSYGEPERISTRTPGAVKGNIGDPIAQQLTVGIKPYQENRGLAKKAAALIKKSRILTPQQSRRSDKRVIEDYMDIGVDNLLWLHDNAPEVIRETGKLWYDGARKIVDAWAEKYQDTPQRVAAIIAALSPGTDWFQNVDRARRIIEFQRNDSNAKWTPKMTKAGEILSRSNTAKLAIKRIKNKPYSDLKTYDDKAVWFRVYDEAYNSKQYPVISPDGTFGEPQTIASGETREIAWGGYDVIARSLRIIDLPADSRESIAGSMTAKGSLSHKIRNFYNNIINPAGDFGDVTVDTHAVAAIYLKPFSQQSPEVKNNLGSGLSDLRYGISGTYGINAEIYRRAAERRGLLPREMQSITWEAIRGLYSPQFKRNEKDVAKINAVWDRHRRGTITLDEARTTITELAGGFSRPDWAGDSAKNEGPRPANDEGGIPGPDLPGRSPRGDTPRDAGGNASGPEIKFSPAARATDVDRLGMYSKAERAIKAARQEKGTGKQFMSALEKAGVKQEEIAETGLDKFLEDNPKTTKEDVLNHLMANQIEVNETVLGGRRVLTPDEQQRLAFLEAENDKKPHGAINDTVGDGAFEELLTLQNIRDGMSTEDLTAAQRTLERQRRFTEAEHLTARIENLELSGSFEDRTKYSRYTAPGSEQGTYRERLLTLPYENFGDSFRSQHFDERNIVAHVRHNTRIGNFGERVLFIEEIQSDWHQEGRRIGYKTPAVKAEMEAKSAELNKQRADLEKKFEKLVIREFELLGLEARQKTENTEAEARELKSLKLQIDENRKQRLDLDRRISQADFPDLTPDAPFKKTWPELSMKRMLRVAAEEGFDAIAWTTGETQAKRYDLSKQVYRLQYDESQQRLMGYRNKDDYAEDIDPIIEKDLSPQQLPDYIGKELAQKLLSQPDGPEGRVIEGDGMKVDSGGMKGFYDRILPTLKTWKQVKGKDGKRLKVELRGVGKALKGHYVKLTPEHRASILEQGLPRFSPGSTELTQSRSLNDRGGAIYNNERGDRAIQLSSRSGVRVYSDRGKRIGPVFSSVEKAQDFLNRN